MEKHTAGPWKVSTEGCKFFIEDYNRYEIARLLPEATGNPRDEELRANSHLIAAAPDLLDLAKMFEAHIMGHKVGVDGEPFTGEKLAQFIKRQIDKAEGR